ncbi:39S ribosomal protein L52, mitochondrial-like [Asterias rubens]|uniref:39S ribosomal protein L52, mitochondrial-like n=1 Tax=Asterias rubens TaxID=7604 RepID=UPI001455AF80|nr:39S ribosomal protein L52, mitochondrial-like [Asterias rubens]
MMYLFTGSLMINAQRMCCVYCIRNSSWVLFRSISTGGNVQAGKSWRISQGESQSGRDYGPLVDLPDWKYADGRPAPLGSGQLKRQQEQRQIAERIDRLASEMTAAIQITQNEERTRQRKQDERNQHKLKAKGQEFRKYKLSSKE